MSIGHAFALAVIVGLLVTCAHYLRDIHSEVRTLTCITLAENGIKCAAIRSLNQSAQEARHG